MGSNTIVLVTLFCVISLCPVLGDDTPVMGAYFYLCDDSYDKAMSASDDIPWNQINRLYIAFVTVDGGEITNIQSDDAVPTDEKIQNVISLCRKKNPDADIFISSNYGDEVTDQYLEAAENPDRFAESVLTCMQKYDIDGYDMDWEDLNINDYADKQVALLQACANTFGKTGSHSPGDRPYNLSCTIWPGVHDPDTVALFADYVDWFNIMSYGPGERYDLSTYATRYAEAGVPYGKMIGGVESESGYSDNGGHDTEDSVNQKAQVVQDLGLGGLMNWRMDNDMTTPDEGTEQGRPTFQVTGWVYQALTGPGQ